MDVPLYKIFSNIKCQYIKYLCISVYGVLLVIIKLQINSVKSVQHFKFDFFLRWFKGDKISNIQKVKSWENFVGLFEHPLYLEY